MDLMLQREYPLQQNMIMSIWSISIYKHYNLKSQKEKKPIIFQASMNLEQTFNLSNSKILVDIIFRFNIFQRFLHSHFNTKSKWIKKKSYV